MKLTHKMYYKVCKYWCMCKQSFDDVYEESLKSAALGALAAGSLTTGAILGVNALHVSPLERIERIIDSPASGAALNADRGSNSIDGISKEFIKAALQYIAPSEGIRSKPYQDSKGKWTVGIGHLILPGEALHRELSPQEILDLFVKDLKEHERRARKLIPKYDSYPQYVRLAILDGIFRGDLAQSKRTRALINTGKWSHVPREYTNNREYINSKSLGDKHGVWKRMDRNANMFLTYANTLNRGT